MDRRAIVLVLDGCGAGFAPDAASFGDPGEPNTLLHVAQTSGPIVAPNLDALGFMASAGVPNRSTSAVAGHTAYARLEPKSIGGKDSVTGHWEMMGIVMKEAFPTYPNGFPIPVIKAFEEAIGTQTLGNRPASGTQIIAELGKLHVDSGFPIVYTSADSVFQIACHEDVVPIEQLYAMCETAREMLVPPNHVQRVIARPFVGNPGAFERTDRRKDYPLTPPMNLVDQIGDVFGIGVVPELFGGRGFRSVTRTQNNEQHFLMLDSALASDASFIFANFEDFDMRFGHRNDPEGFARCLEQFDVGLSRVLGMLQANDLLILTADHGNDPTDSSTDHSREYVPMSLYRPGSTENPAKNLGDLAGFETVGAVVAEWLGAKWQGAPLADDLRDWLA